MKCGNEKELGIVHKLVLWLIGRKNGKSKPSKAVKITLFIFPPASLLAQTFHWERNSSSLGARVILISQYRHAMCCQWLMMSYLYSVLKGQANHFSDWIFFNLLCVLFAVPAWFDKTLQNLQSPAPQIRRWLWLWVDINQPQHCLVRKSKCPSLFTSWDLGVPPAQAPGGRPLVDRSGQRAAGQMRSRTPDLCGEAALPREKPRCYSCINFYCYYLIPILWRFYTIKTTWDYMMELVTHGQF